MFNEAIKTIETTLQSAWTTTPIDFDNIEYNPIIGTPFIRLQIEWVDSNHAAVGGGRTRGEGYIDVSVFVPSNTGVQDANAMADSIAAIYKTLNSGALTCGAPRTIRVGEQEEWYQLKVLIPFKYDECNA